MGILGSASRIDRKPDVRECSLSRTAIKLRPEIS
jgi:hypothetical protein